MSCTVTPRTVITDAVFVSSTVAETDHAVWDAGTTYGIGDNVIKNHRIYESLRVSNLNFDPVTDTSSPPYWLDTGPTNRWGMLDDSVSTLTTSAGSSMTIVLSPGRMDTLGLLDVDASEVRVQLSTIADGTFYDVTHSMTDREVLTDSWSTYFYGGFINKSTLVLPELPVSVAVTLTLTFSKSSGTVACGLVTFGLSSVLGETQYGAKIGIIDYSRKETDAFGRTTLVQRSFAKTMDVALYLNRSQVDAVSRKLAEVRSTACLWVAANEQYDSLSVYGFFRDWSIGIEYFDGSTCNLTIEGLT